MKVLIIGGGGREHAIAVAMKKSGRVDALYCVPGNAGIAEIAECEPSIGVMEFDRIVAYAREKQVDLVFVAPDDPLAGGLVDRLEEAGLRAFGPRKNAAILEGTGGRDYSAGSRSTAQSTGEFTGSRYCGKPQK